MNASKALKIKGKMVGTAGFEPATTCTPYMAFIAANPLKIKQKTLKKHKAKRGVLRPYESISYLLVLQIVN